MKKIRKLASFISPRKHLISIVPLIHFFDPNSDTMKELFKESVDGLKLLLRQQIAYVNEKSMDGRKCLVSVRVHPF